MAATLTQLLVVPTTSALAQTILADLAAQDPPLPTTSWQSGSVAQVLIAVFSDSEQNLYQSQSAIAAGGYLGLATGDWLTLLAQQNYLVYRAAPVATQGLVQFTDSGGGPYTLTAGTTTVSNGSRTYVAQTGGTLPLNKSVFIRVGASLPGQAGNLANGAITTLVTALAGVTVSNVVPWISVLGTAAVKTRGYIKLTSAGGGSFAVGACTVNDGTGHSYTNVSATTLAAATQTEVLFEAAAVGTAYNVGNGLITTVGVDPLGDITCTNTAPSVNITSWITTSGSDEQSDASLTTECRNRLLALGVGWTAAAIEYLVSQAPISTGESVTRTSVVTNPGGIAGLVGVYIATAAGAPASQTVTDVQTYLDDNRTLTSSITVTAASTKAITITGTASVPAAYLSTAQANATVNLAALAANTPIGGSAAAGYAVQLEDIVSAIKAATYDSSGNNTNPASPTQLSLSAPAADVALASTEVPVFTVNITWTGV